METNNTMNHLLQIEHNILISVDSKTKNIRVKVNSKGNRLGRTMEIRLWIGRKGEIGEDKHLT